MGHYKYSHENSEIWKENELIKINTNSITNSKDKYELNGQQNLENFEFIGIEGKQLTHKNIIPISYWNRDILDNNEFLDTQKEELETNENLLKTLDHDDTTQSIIEEKDELLSENNEVLENEYNSGLHSLEIKIID